MGEQQGQQQDEGFIVAVIENRAKEVGFAVFEVANVRLRLFQFVGEKSDLCMQAHPRPVSRRMKQCMGAVQRLPGRT